MKNFANIEKIIGRLLRGNGQVVDGDKGVDYLHKELPVDKKIYAMCNGVKANGHDIIL